eukprot:5259688-Lingulodinium_polyedra.AAC.1
MALTSSSLMLSGKGVGAYSSVFVRLYCRAKGRARKRALTSPERCSSTRVSAGGVVAASLVGAISKALN